MNLETSICVKYFFFHLCVVSNSIWINRTNIIYQYSMLCGPDTYTDLNRTQRFSKIPEEYRMCPTCNYDKICYQHGDCCPEVYVRYPPLECYDVTIHDNKNRRLHSYELVTTCPNAVPQDIADICTKTGDISDKVRNPPVTSKSTGLSFKNVFCSTCHNISDVTPWTIFVNKFYGRNFDLYTVDEMITTIIKDNGSTITFSPARFLPAKKCSILRDTNGYVDTCNLTGTWRTYDQDIIFACENFGNKFKFYKNIFCYICNPPYISEQNLVLSFCNVTGNWKHYDKGIQDGCIHGGSLDAAFPFKNIYCYICNMDTPPTSDYFLHVSLSSFQYYLFDTSDGLNFSNNTCDKNTIRQVEYHKAYTKFECQSHLPIGILDIVTASSFKKLAFKHNCFISLGSDSVLMTNYSGWFSEIEFAFLTNNYILVFVATKPNAVCFEFFGNSFCDSLKGHMNFNCESIYSDIKAYIQPFELIICKCVDVDFTWSAEEKPLNIFYIDQYPTMTQKCFSDEIFDKQQQKCRKTGCFFGKASKDGECLSNLNHSPAIMTSTQGYTLPLLFKIPKNNSYSENIIFQITQELASKMALDFNITANLCHTILRNGEEIQFILQVIIIYGISKYSEIRNLESFVSYLLEHLHGIHNLSVYYDSVTRDFINNNGNLSECTSGWRPLLSKVIFCRHVIYNHNEYQINAQTAKIIGFRNTLEFYEYDQIDGKLMICIEDYERLEKNESSDFAPYVIFFVCNGISIVFLFLTFITYCLFPSLRTIPGKLIINLSFSLMAHYISYILIMVKFESGTLCTMLGILTHYFLLTSIGSLFVCAWHMFRVFGTSSLASSIAASQNQQASIQYLLFTYLYALIIVILNVIVNIVVTSGYSLGYGEHTCFISYKESIIGSLILPLLILSSADIVLYTVTVNRLLRRPKADDTESVNRKDLMIFTKLFVTTGCSWILLVVNVFIDDQFVTLAISCINSIQGVFIFTAYILNKRIFNMYKSKIRHWKRTQKSDNGSPSTSMSSLSRTRTKLADQSTPFLQKSK